MAARKTHNFLPTVFQTDTNKKFLSATVDQLVSEPDFVNVYGYIGRKFAPTYKSGDSYVTEPNASRQNYQLEPSVVIKDTQKNITFFATYLDHLFLFIDQNFLTKILIELTNLHSSSLTYDFAGAGDETRTHGVS